MEILYLLIPLSVVFVFMIGVVFWWSLKSGQFEDLEGPAYRILRDNDDGVIATDAEPPALPPLGPESRPEAKLPTIDADQ